MAMDVAARIRNAQARIEKRIEERAEAALWDLEMLADLFQVRADFDWLLAQAKALFPLHGKGGVYEWIEEHRIRQLAAENGLSHMADAIIDHLNDDPCAPAFIPSRAAIIMRNDEALSIPAGAY